MLPPLDRLLVSQNRSKRGYRLRQTQRFKVSQYASRRFVGGTCLFDQKVTIFAQHHPAKRRPLLRLQAALRLSDPTMHRSAVMFAPGPV